MPERPNATVESLADSTQTRPKAWDKLSLSKIGLGSKKDPTLPDSRPETLPDQTRDPQQEQGERSHSPTSARSFVVGLQKSITSRGSRLGKLKRSQEQRDHNQGHQEKPVKRRRNSSSAKSRSTTHPSPRGTRSPSTSSNEPTGSQGARSPRPEDVQEQPSLSSSLPPFTESDLPTSSTASGQSITDTETASESLSDDLHDPQFREELDARWTLNLSMAFRDSSDREKFFITYAPHPKRWFKVTVTCDYRGAQLGSLEYKLKEYGYQRDKSAEIYKALRESLPNVEFYETITNLKLRTENKRLHVHVTEDQKEIIKYPAVSAINHLKCDRIKENQLSFVSHLSGFVYKVSYHGKYYIKKEIPSPDMVDEFLYEVNALARLQTSSGVIHLRGAVLDDHGRELRGLLMSYAEKGALVDLLYEHKMNNSRVPWTSRLRWAKQLVRGLRDIHEAGYVQGDFTLSNIVIDARNDAKIIDLNRRGCPVGCEPPEFKDLIQNGQRVSMYIGEKSDIFQLGMVLWALALHVDEPELEEDELDIENADPEVPKFYRNVVSSCLASAPQERAHASDVFLEFPHDEIDAIPASAPSMGQDNSCEFDDSQDDVWSGRSVIEDKQGHQDSHNIATQDPNPSDPTVAAPLLHHQQALLTTTAGNEDDGCDNQHNTVGIQLQEEAISPTLPDNIHERISHLMHHDSGIVDEEEYPSAQDLDDYLQPHIHQENPPLAMSPLLHQDSGFDDIVLTGIGEHVERSIKDKNVAKESGGDQSLPVTGELPHDLVGIGGAARNK